MFSLKSIVLITAAFAMGTEASGVVPAVAAPLVAPAQVGYAHAVPQNVAPYASQISVVSKAISPYVAGPVLSAPLAAPVIGHLGAPIAARVAAPYVATPGPVLASPYAAAAAYSSSLYAPVPYAATPYAAAPYAAAPYALPGQIAASPAYAAPFPYAAAAPLIRSPFGVAPALVR